LRWIVAEQDGGLGLELFVCKISLEFLGLDKPNLIEHVCQLTIPTVPGTK